MRISASMVGRAEVRSTKAMETEGGVVVVLRVGVAQALSHRALE